MNLTFLFSAALWALPLVGLPVLLHLLFRRKSPVVAFPTLRFIRASVQQTAARKKVHRWLLLTLRALALLALIWAIAQPAVRPSGAWAGQGAKSSAAVIVLDTSYSLQLSDKGTTVAGRADQAVRELLAGQLRGMKVAILRSSPAPADRPEAAELRAQETFRDASDIQWSLPLPQPAVVPLIDRIQTAAAMLEKQPVDDRWLIVISDFQKREFPRSLPEPAGVRLVLIDLHPADVRTVSVSRVEISPQQPTPGILSEAVIDLAGRPRDVRQVNVSVTALDEEGSTSLPPAPVNLDETGHARLRMPLAIPPRGFLAIDALLTVDEPLAWAKSRRLLVQVPPRQNVVVLDGADLADVRQRVAWALDPTGGQSAAWALAVRQAPSITPETNVAVLVMADWPDATTAGRLADFVRAGNTLILFARPGLEATWQNLPQAQRDVLLQLLPGVPAADFKLAGAYRTTVASPADAVLTGLTDERFQIGSMTVRRLLPLDVLLPQTTTVLGVAEADASGSGNRPAGLLFRRAVGAGRVFTFATLPDKAFSTMHLHPTFVPMLVQMALRPPTRSDAQNLEIGTPLTLTDAKFLKFAELRMEGPGGDVTAVKPTLRDGKTLFHFDRAESAGIYTWRNPADDTAVAMANVQLPAAETELVYTPADRLVGENSLAVIATSAADLSAKFASLSQPEPRWAIPLAIVMALLCCEALVGSLRR